MDCLGLGDGKAQGIAHRAIHCLSGNSRVLALEEPAAKSVNAKCKMKNAKFKMKENPGTGFLVVFVPNFCTLHFAICILH
jgi:hypothetical protein